MVILSLILFIIALIHNDCKILFRLENIQFVHGGPLLAEFTCFFDLSPIPTTLFVYDPSRTQVNKMIIVHYMVQDCRFMYHSLRVALVLMPMERLSVSIRCSSRRLPNFYKFHQCRTHDRSYKGQSR